MFELMKKSLLLGLGTAVVTKSKVQESMQKLVDQGKLTTEEAERLSQEIIEAGETELNEARGQISQTWQKFSQSLDLPRRSELDELLARMDNLEKRLNFLEDKVSTKVQAAQEDKEPS
jgi:polyhydroxyalkanoate synthesis regulator phasin